jgi:hypothetical protein
LARLLLCNDINDILTIKNPLYIQQSMYKGRIYLTIRGSTLFLPNGNTFFTIITVSPGLIGTARRWSSLALLLGHFQHMCPSLEKPVTGTFLFNALSKVYFKKLTVSRRKFCKKSVYFEHLCHNIIGRACASHTLPPICCLARKMHFNTLSNSGKYSSKTAIIVFFISDFV